jgi:hypothetical protein
VGIGSREENAGKILEPLAGIGVAYPHHEEAEAEGQHDDIKHEVLLCVVREETNGVLALAV